MNIILFGGALGGIGLFLLGMRLMTEGLRVAAGPMLRKILARWTRTRLRGLLSGLLLTGVVQSSSAVTVASIGFVNAGVLTLGQAMWVIFGSNIGTTMTGWIVAAVGFDIKIEAFALPLLGAGMFLSLTGTETRRGALGEALAGFGVFFLGIATLKATFSGLGDAVDLATYATGGIGNDALFALIGFIMTALLQSSSAVIAIALTAAVGGMLTVEAGAALIVGANVGTTTTALLAVIGATSNVRRVAVSHVAFNLLTGVVAIALLPLMLVLVEATEKMFALASLPATTLALFHTTFNVLGVLLMWPLARRLEHWLQGRFVTREEDLSRPRHLDGTILGVPALALNAILLEMRRVADTSLSIARSAFTSTEVPIQKLWRQREVIEHLNGAIVEYIQKLSATKNSLGVAEALTHPVRALLHFSDIADHGIALAERRSEIRALPAGYLDHIANMGTVVAGQLDGVLAMFNDPAREPPSNEPTDAMYRRIKADILNAASAGDLTSGQAETALESISDLRDVGRMINKVSLRIAAVAKVAQGQDEDDEDDEDEETQANPDPQEIPGDDARGSA
jgi:phosphate:Na+ symporter